MLFVNGPELKTGRGQRVGDSCRLGRTQVRSQKSYLRTSDKSCPRWNFQDDIYKKFDLPSGDKKPKAAGLRVTDPISASSNLNVEGFQKSMKFRISGRSQERDRPDFSP